MQLLEDLGPQTGKGETATGTPGWGSGPAAQLVPAPEGGAEGSRPQGPVSAATPATWAAAT